MNKKIIFTEPGGFPLTQDTLDFLQKSYVDALGSIAQIVGNYVILSGSQATGGWCCIGGELVPFAPGITGNCYIQETVQSALFDDGQNKLVYKTRTLVAGLGTPQYSWASFQTTNSIKGLGTAIVSLTNSLNTLSTTLAGHTANLSNPHATTKAQVGLGSLPNAISNDPLLNSPGVLATTAATSALIRQIDTVTIGDVGAITPSARVTNITNSGGSDSKCKVLFSPAFTTAPRAVIPIVKIADNASWNNNNDIIVTLSDIQADGFVVAFREVSSQVQSISLTYIVF